MLFCSVSEIVVVFFEVSNKTEQKFAQYCLFVESSSHMLQVIDIFLAVRIIIEQTLA